MPAVVLYYFSRYCTVRLKMFYFLCLFFMYYLCENDYKPVTAQYYIANCVSWVPRLTLLDLTNKLDLTNALSERNSCICRGLTVIITIKDMNSTMLLKIKSK